MPVASFLIEASRNLRLQNVLNFATCIHPILIFENRSRQLFLIVVITRMERFYISYIYIGFYVEENTADVDFFKILNGLGKKSDFQVYGRRSNKISLGQRYLRAVG